MSTLITVVVAVALLVAAMAVFIIVLMLLDRWHRRQAWRAADRMAREYMRRHYCSHGFSIPEHCPTCRHFTKVREVE